MDGKKDSRDSGLRYERKIDRVYEIKKKENCVERQALHGTQKEFYQNSKLRFCEKKKKIILQFCTCQRCESQRCVGARERRKKKKHQNKGLHENRSEIWEREGGMKKKVWHEREREEK